MHATCAPVCPPRRLLERKETLPKDCIGRVLLDLEDPSLGGKLDRKRLVSNVAMFFVAGVVVVALFLSHTKTECMLQSNGLLLGFA